MSFDPRASEQCTRAGAIALGVLLALLGSPQLARAQDDAVSPPRVVTLPALSLAPDVEVPEGGTVDVTVLIAADGVGTVEECTHEEALCAAVREAIAQGSFEPAQRGGSAIPARVKIGLRVVPADTGERSDTDTDKGTGEPEAVSGLPPTAAVVATPEPPSTYGAQAHVRTQQPGARRLELAEMRDMPGALGDPYRAIEALPGIVPVLSGLPYLFVRGAPPAGSLYYYDDLQLPTLYHLAAGPAVIHPLLVGPIKLYSGVAPARYGRLVGGTIVGEGPEPPDGRTHVQGELRLLDISGYAQTKLLGGTLTAAARYGYPALLLSIFSPKFSASYWDYQLRYAYPLSPRDQLELIVLGSYDSFQQLEGRDSDVLITFHRAEPRWIHRQGQSELGVALTLGWERSGFDDDFQVKSRRIGPRAWFEHRFAGRSQLRLSADTLFINGGFMSFRPSSNLSQELGLGEFSSGARSVLGAQAELTLRPWDMLELQVGARGDAWLQRDVDRFAFDPRLRLILHASEVIDVHVAGGLVHQPAVPYLPLPGLADFSSARDLQTATQSELGVGWDTPYQLRAELQLFAHRYENLVFTDTRFLFDAFNQVCRNIDCMSASVPSRIDGWSYGLELFLRRPISHALSGFISYTLAWSSVDRVAGLPYTASWDVRHVANLVLQWRIAGGFSAAVRGMLRSGKSDGFFYLSDQGSLGREERRLPGFARLDLEVAYAWQTSWGRMRFGFEWFNATLAREAEALNCDTVNRQCNVDMLPPIFFPNLSLRAEN